MGVAALAGSVVCRARAVACTILQPLPGRGDDLLVCGRIAHLTRQGGHLAARRRQDLRISLDLNDLCIIYCGIPVGYRASVVYSNIAVIYYGTGMALSDVNGAGASNFSENGLP